MTRRLVSLMAGLALMAAPASADRPTLPADRPEIVAHRGASADAPENTMASVKLGWEQQADAVEVDVFLTADNRVVCLHDKDLKRTTGDTRAIKDVAWADVAGLDAGSWKDPKWAGEPIPLLAPVMATVPDGKRLFVEIKCGPEIVPYLVEHVAAAGKKPEQIAFISFGAEVCAAVKKALPAHQVYYLSGFKTGDDGVVRPSFDELIAKARELGVDGLDVSYKGPLNADVVRRVHEAGLFLAVYTVDDPAVAADLAGMGVDSITTNKPGVMREHFEAAPRLPALAP